MKQPIMADGPRCKRRKQANPRRKNGKKRPEPNFSGPLRGRRPGRRGGEGEGSRRRRLGLAGEPPSAASAGAPRAAASPWGELSKCGPSERRTPKGGGAPSAAKRTCAPRPNPGTPAASARSAPRPASPRPAAGEGRAGAPELGRARLRSEGGRRAVRVRAREGNRGCFSASLKVSCRSRRAASLCAK